GQPAPAAYRGSPGPGMIRRVEVLWLSGLSSGEAVRSADELVRDRSVPDLTCLLIVDDTATLPGHGDALDHLLTSGRGPPFLCVAAGRPEEEGLVRLPGSVSTWKDSAILWVGDPLGVDWEPGASAVELFRPADGPDGLNCLIEILSSAEVYDRVRELAAEIPNALACPGLRLAETDADVGGFLGVLAGASERLARRGGAAVQGADHPFGELRAVRTTAPVITETGELARARRQCATAAEEADRALEEVGHLAGLLGPGRSPAETRERVSDAG